MPHRPKTYGEVAEENIILRTTTTLKNDFQRAIAVHPDLKNMSHFLEECMKALVLQMRHGEAPAFPLEFVAAAIPKAHLPIKPEPEMESLRVAEDPPRYGGKKKKRR